MLVPICFHLASAILCSCQNTGAFWCVMQDAGNFESFSFGGSLINNYQVRRKTHSPNDHGFHSMVRRLQLCNWKCSVPPITVYHTDGRGPASGTARQTCPTRLAPIAVHSRWDTTWARRMQPFPTQLANYVVVPGQVGRPRDRGRTRRLFVVPLSPAPIGSCQAFLVRPARAGLASSHDFLIRHREDYYGL